MSEQLQNQNLPTEEELRARDDAIFNTVADFRNELDNPVEQPEAHAQVPEFSDVAAHDAENKPVDVNAIFDNRKAEISVPGNGRRRKAYSEEAELEAKRAGMQYRAKRVAQQMAEGIALQGMPKHRGPEEFVARAEATPDDIAAHRAGKKNGESADSAGEDDGDDYDYQGNPYEPAELQEGKDPVIDTAALARAEQAARDMPREESVFTRQSRRKRREAQAATPDTDEGTPAATPAATRGRHRAPSGRKAPRVMADGQVGAGYTGSIRVVGESNTANADDDEAVPVVVTPEARRRDRIAARLGKLVDEETRNDLRAARDEMVESWRQLRESFRGRRPGAAATGKLATMAAGVRSGASRATGATRQAARTTAGNAKELGAAAKDFANYSADLVYRKPKEELTDRERKARPYAKGLSVAVGALALTAGLVGANKMINSHDVEYGKETPAAAGAQAYGPQAPKTSETPEPTVSATPTHVSKPVAKPSASVGPSAIPSSPNLWANKPQVPDNNANTTPSAGTSQEQTHTKDLDHEEISFTTTKDGKVTHVTAKLHEGGSIEEAGRAAGLTATEVANAVNKAGITNQQAEHLPVGQQMNFDRQADGSYVVHLK